MDNLTGGHHVTRLQKVTVLLVAAVASSIMFVILVKEILPGVYIFLHKIIE